MKKIYKTKQGLWVEEKPEKNNLLYEREVRDDINPFFLTSPYYTHADFIEEEYDKAYIEWELDKAKEYLKSTDYIVHQWKEEEFLKIPHYRNEKEYKEILEKRQKVREFIRKNSF